MNTKVATANNTERVARLDDELHAYVRILSLSCASDYTYTTNLDTV